VVSIIIECLISQESVSSGREKEYAEEQQAGADLLNDSVEHEIGQEQRGDEHGAEDGFDAV
jgi:hypothetical protein